MPEEAAQAVEAKALGGGARRARKCTIHIIESRCKGCGFCIEFCPRDVLEVSETLAPNGYHPPYAARMDQCTCCRTCQLVCPDFAIYVADVEPASGSAER